jgi:hypothetical protein
MWTLHFQQPSRGAGRRVPRDKNVHIKKLLAAHSQFFLSDRVLYNELDSRFVFSPQHDAVSQWNANFSLWNVNSMV